MQVLTIKHLELFKAKIVSLQESINSCNDSSFDIDYAKCMQDGVLNDEAFNIARKASRIASDENYFKTLIKIDNLKVAIVECEKQIAITEKQIAITSALSYLD